MERFKIEWQAPEFHYREKGVSWYWISAIFAIIILSISVWQKNFLFSVFIVIAEILILVWAGQKPRELTFSLDDKGLTINNMKLYPYQTIEAFSLDQNETDGWHELAFRFNHGIRPWLKIKIPAEKSNEIESALSPLVKKTDFEESLLDIIQKLIGF